MLKATGMAFGSVRRLAFALRLGLGLGVAEPLHAETPTDPGGTGASIDDGTVSARRHFKNGIKLYQDANYRGALAEFEAAYAEKPGPGSLQNVALTLKALFRYAEAADALRLLLERHGEELSASEREAVQAAIIELGDLVGTLELEVQPANATLTVNGKEVSIVESARGLLLSVGEHTVIVEAPGHERLVQVVRMASQQRLKMPIRLRPTAGFLEIVATDSKAAIAVDGEPVAYQEWTGPVTPNVEHTVQVYRDGFEPFEKTVRVAVGQTVRVAGMLGAETGDAVDDPRPLPSTPAAPPEPQSPTGWYGLASATLVGLNDAPLGFEVTDTASNMSLPSLGIRGGYRLSTVIAIEAALDGGAVNVDGACQRGAETQGAGCDAKRDFSLSSVRFGPNLRLYTPGEVIRFTTAVGAGIVAHELKLDPATGEGGAMLAGGRAQGVDPYFCLELGVSFNFRHLLAELAAIAYIEGATELSGAFDDNEKRAVFESGTLPMLGIGLKIGYSAWAPKR